MVIEFNLKSFLRKFRHFVKSNIFSLSIFVDSYYHSNYEINSIVPDTGPDICVSQIFIFVYNQQSIFSQASDKTSFHIGYFRDDPSEEKPAFVASSTGVDYR